LIFDRRRVRNGEAIVESRGAKRRSGSGAATCETGKRKWNRGARKRRSESGTATCKATKRKWSRDVRNGEVKVEPRRAKRRSESGTRTRPGILPRVKARENGREELAFPAPVQGPCFYRAGEFAGTCHRLPRGGSLLLVSCDQEVRRRAESVRDATKKWRGSNKPAASRVTPLVPWLRDPG
jgi:hypothetical protein